MSGHDWEGLLAGIYEAAYEPEKWLSVLAAVRRSAGGAAGYLIKIDKTAPGVPWAVEENFDPSVPAAYAAHYVQVCPRYRHHIAHPERRIVYDSLHITDAEMDKDEFYAWMGSKGYRYYLGAVVRNDSRHSVALTLQRSAREGHATPDQIRLLERLTPHLANAIDLGSRASFADMRGGIFERLAESLPCGALVLDVAGRIAFANAAAAAILRREDGLRVREGRLVASAPADARRLAAETARAIAAGAAGHGARFTVARRDSARPYFVVIAAVASGDMRVLGRAPSVLVFITDPDAVPLPEAEAARIAFGLTAAEADLAVALAADEDVATYAERKGLSPNTVRWHLKRILAKTDTHRQSSLVRLLISLAATRQQGPEEG